MQIWFQLAYLRERPPSVHARRYRLVMWGVASAEAVLGILLVAGYVAAYVDPRHVWWLQIVALGLPAVSVLFLCLTGFLLFTGRVGLAAANAPILVLLLIRYAPPMHGQSEQSVDESPFVVMTYNAKEKVRSAGMGLRTIIREQEPHVVALQEARVVCRPKEGLVGAKLPVLLALDGYTACGRNASGDAELYALEQPLFSRVPRTEWTQFTLTTEPVTTSSSVMTRGQYRLGPKQVAVYNLHLRSFSALPDHKHRLLRWLDPRYLVDVVKRLRTDVLARANEAERARSILDREQNPFILCGDLNSTPDNWSYRLLAGGLQDAFRSVGRGWGATYHARFPFVRIDYIFAGPEWKLLGSRALSLSYSDHRPVIARLALESR